MNHSWPIARSLVTAGPLAVASDIALRHRFLGAYMPSGYSEAVSPGMWVTA